MISFLSSWAEQVILAVIIATILELILPNSKNKKYVQMVIGVYVLFNIISPIIKNKEKLVFSEIDLDKYITTSTKVEQSSMDARLEKIYLDELENNIKSIISYQLSKKYGYREKDYLNPNNFNYIPEKRRQVNDLLGKMKRQIKDNAVNHTATKHYINNYGYIPLWVLVKVLSFGIVSELFSILKKEDQYDIVELYDLDVNVFTNYLSSLSNYRNLCAHEDILYNNRTQKSILDTKYHRLLNIPIMDNEYIYGKNDLFSVVIMMKSMIKKDEFDLFEKEISDLIDELDNKLKSIEINKILDCMGFPKNWKELKDIDKKEIF